MHPMSGMQRSSSSNSRQHGACRQTYRRLCSVAIAVWRALLLDVFGVRSCRDAGLRCCQGDLWRGAAVLAGQSFSSCLLICSKAGLCCCHPGVGWDSAAVLLLSRPCLPAGLRRCRGALGGAATILVGLSMTIGLSCAAAAAGALLAVRVAICICAVRLRLVAIGVSCTGCTCDGGCILAVCPAADQQVHLDLVRMCACGLHIRPMVTAQHTACKCSCTLGP